MSYVPRADETSKDRHLGPVPALSSHLAVPDSSASHSEVAHPSPAIGQKERFPTASGPSRGLSPDLRSAGRWDHDCDRISRVFIGTSLSTFSFRIHEEREILGFDPKTTYNRFCGDQEDACEKPTHWKVLY